MTSPDDPATDPAEVLRMEAAGWFARMRRDDAERFRPEFEAWLADAGHRAAYNRIAMRFTDAKILQQGRAVSAAALPSPPRAPRIGAIAMLAGVAALVLFAAMLGPRFGWRSSDAPLSLARLEAVNGAVTRFRLRDGSVVTLDGNALVTVRLDGQGRDLRLKRGRARFAVAHDSRPFTVIAADGKVTARGTIFDMAVAAGVADVVLIEGAVDVAADANGGGQVARLKAGERVAVAHGRISEKPAFAPRAAPDWPRAIVEVRDMPLDMLLARANRLSVIQLEPGNEVLGRTLISGRFRLDDPLHLAANLAGLLDLEQRKDGARIMLVHRDP